MTHPPLHVLCIEPRFPGRLGPVADWLVRRRGYRCQFYCHSADPRDRWPPSVGCGLDVVPFGVGGVARESHAHWTRQLERGLCYAYGCWEVLQARQPRPVDLVLGRSNGLGSTLFVPACLPGVPIVNLLDYFYLPHENDVAGLAGSQTPAEYFHWRRSANAMDLLDLENGVTPWTITEWQRTLFPVEYRDDIAVQSDGVDTSRFVDRRDGRPRTVAGRMIPAGWRVVSFVARCLDRTRGFDRFMELANRLLRMRSDVLCLVIGGTPVERPFDLEFYQRDYRGHVLGSSPPADPERLWVLDSVPHPVVAEALGISDLHIYPGRPYVVSRSLVEAMAAGCVVLAADTAPVREFISHEHTGLLVCADDFDAWARQACAVLDAPHRFRPLGAAAAGEVRERFGQDSTMPALATLFDQLVAAHAARSRNVFGRTRIADAGTG